MMVFFRRLPAGTSKKDLEDFINPALKGGLFSKRGQATNISIIERPSPQHSKTMEYHGIVVIEPDSVAERIIKKLSRKKMFKGKYIEVRQYFQRSSANDPRNKNHILDEIPDSRRQRERRQKAQDSSLNFMVIKGTQRKG